jgi:hypothetical protein
MKKGEAELAAQVPLYSTSPFYQFFFKVLSYARRLAGNRKNSDFGELWHKKRGKQRETPSPLKVDCDTPPLPPIFALALRTVADLSS